MLVRKIAGNSKNEIILEHARAAAQAELDLARVPQAKIALIERVSALGSLDALRFLALSLNKSVILGRFCGAGRRPPSHNASTPWRRCRLRSLGAQRKPCAGRYRNWLSWIDTNPEPSLGAIVRSDRSSKKDQVAIADHFWLLTPQIVQLLCPTQSVQTDFRPGSSGGPASGLYRHLPTYGQSCPHQQQLSETEAGVWSNVRKILDTTQE